MHLGNAGYNVLGLIWVIRANNIGLCGLRFALEPILALHPPITADVVGSAKGTKYDFHVQFSLLLFLYQAIHADLVGGALNTNPPAAADYGK